MFTAEALLVGAIAAFAVGVSKTGLPGGALVATPLLATVFDGRLIAGGTLPILLVADVFAVAWYRQHARWDVLRPIGWWIALGYVFGISFFIAVGSATDTIEVTIGVIVLVIVGLQILRMFRSARTTEAGTAAAATYGSIGGFTTFVANAAGPVINTYLIRLGLPKHEMVGTSAWLYFVINLSKIPLYLALGAWAAGGPFFTRESLLFDLAVTPAVFAGAFGGRALFHRVRQDVFVSVVLALSVLGGLKLVI